jgi:hypothetical protein
MRKTLPFLLLLGALAPGCGAVLGVGAGVLISQDVVDSKQYVAIINRDAKITWATAKSVLSHESEELVDTDEDLRTCQGTVDGATVKVGVEVYDLNTARLSVSAKQYGVDNGEMAKYVLDKIVRALEETAP